MTLHRTSLTGFAAQMRDPDPEAAKHISAQAWHEAGIIIIVPEWFRSFTDQKQAELLAELLFGKRREENG